MGCSAGAGVLCCGGPAPLERRGTGPARPGPHFLGRNGGKNPRGRRFLPRDPLLWWGCGGGGCTSVLVPGLRPSQRKARNGPPTGWAGWGRGQVPFGKRRRKTISFPTFSSRQRTTSPARPSWWAGHEALVLEAAGQVDRSKNHATSTTGQRKGVWGKETLSPTGVQGAKPLGALSPISPEKWGPAREGTVPARSNGAGESPQRPPPGKPSFPPFPTAPGKASPTPLSPKRGGFFSPLFGHFHTRR